MIAFAEITLGSLVLHWACTDGIHDDSSLGSVVFLWGSIGALCCLLLPGLMLLRTPPRWSLQLLPALLVVVFGTVWVASFLSSWADPP